AHGDYGLAIDPASGNIWHCYLEGGQISKYSPDGQWSGDYNHSFSSDRAQGAVVDDNGNVWVAHALDTGNTVGRLRTDGTYVGDVDLRLGRALKYAVGPTGVAVDKNGKIWVVNYNDCSAMRINPDGGGAGVVDAYVDLGLKDGPGSYCGNPVLKKAGFPYNYSDMTGFLNVK